MMRANTWPRSPGAALVWLLSPLQRKPCELLVDTQWTDRGGDRKNLKQLLDRLTQMSEGSQGGVRQAAIKAQTALYKYHARVSLWARCAIR
jgi:hypothetical protein